MKIVKLVQGSPEWHQHRLTHRNASETAAVLGESPWTTPYQLWQERTGRLRREVNAAMAHGTRLEPLAREAYEQLTGHVMEPLVLVDGEYSASMDGITLDGGLALEIKCPVKGRESTLWAEVSGGHLPTHYYWQVQHQLMVSGAARMHVYVFDGIEGVLLEQQPKRDVWPRIRQGWDQLMELIRNDQPPPLTDRDTVVRSDEEWLTAAREFVEAKRLADDVAVGLDAARMRLAALAVHCKEEGGGVCVSRYWKVGNIDYKRVPQLAEVDLSLYRGPSREEIRVTLAGINGTA